MARSKITKSFTYEGKRHYVSAPTEAEASVKAAMMLRDLEENKTVVTGNTTVSEWAYKAVKVYKTNQADITQKKYIQRMKSCILSEIGNMPLKQVKPLHCQNTLNLQKGKSKRQINEVAQTLNFIFRKALENNLITSNPAEYLTKPSGTKTSRRSLTDNERKHFQKVCADDRFIVFLLMYFCGCRPSEAREVKGMDIQMVDGVNALHIRGTKTARSDRVVPLPDPLYERIKDTGKFKYAAPNENGSKHTDKSYGRAVKSLYRQMNISMGCKVYRNSLIPPLPLADDFVPYCLRHTYCTDLQKAGVDIRAAQYLMGHSDIKLTANIYTHLDNRTVGGVALLLSGTTGGTTPDTTKNHQKKQGI